MSDTPGVSIDHPSIDGERRFEAHELFFSTTDRKGIITSANEVFERVSGYPRSEIIGKPHNLVRHDDMPRIAFKLLWDEITAGRPFAAYVKNRTAGGQFYWVIATVIPIAGGYLSIRLAPSTEHFHLAQGLYRQLRAIEREIEGPGGLHRKEAMAASATALDAALRGAGYESYDQFMRSALLAEVRTREEHLCQTGYRTADQAGPVEGPWKAALAAIGEVQAFLRQLVLRLEEYRELNIQLAAKAALVRELADDVRLFALNAIISSSRTSGANAAVGAVAELLSSRSDVSGPLFGGLADAVGEASSLLGDMLFPVAAVSLQAETLDTFLRELATREMSAGDQRDLEAVHACFATGLQQLAALLAHFWERLSSLRPSAESLRREMDTMRALSLNGRIESARLDQGETFSALFLTVAEHVETSRIELDGLGKLGNGLFAEDARAMPRVQAAAASLDVAIAAA